MGGGAFDGEHDGSGSALSDAERCEFELAVEAESAALHVLRETAKAELATVIELHAAMGEEPWRFLPELPTLDEQVILDLYRERSTLPDNVVARARAYHPTARPGQAQQFEFQMLRAISLEHPALSPAVWNMLDRAPQPIGRAG